MIKKLIRDISENGRLPMSVFENILYVSYDGVWHAIGEEQYEYFYTLKSIIEESIEDLNRLTMKVTNND
ncbi:MAG: hypothetical protein GQ531_03090 [Sulfurovum sp.]|nr:hypothetical protein [Sulfurovum sp.]